MFGFCVRRQERCCNTFWWSEHICVLNEYERLSQGNSSVIFSINHVGLECMEILANLQTVEHVCIMNQLKFL